MSTVSFKRAQELPIEEQQTATPTTTELATVGSTALAPARFDNPALEGEFTQKDMGMPYLSLGQKSGTLCDEHPDWLGTWVLDKTHSLGKEIQVIFVHLRKFYQQKTEYGSDEIPERWQTVAEAKASGLEYQEVAEIDMLVNVNGTPAVDNAMVGDFAPARFTARSTAYGKMVGVVMKDLAGWLKNDIASGLYKVGVEKKSNGKNSWFAPKMKADGKVPAELRAEIKATFQV